MTQFEALLLLNLSTEYNFRLKWEKTNKNRYYFSSNTLLLNRVKVIVCLKLGGLDHAWVTWISGCLLKLTVWMPLCTETCRSDMDLLHVSTVVLWSHALGCLIAKFPPLKLHLTVHPVLNHLTCSFEVLPIHNGGHGSDGVVLFATDTLVDLLDVKI